LVQERPDAQALSPEGTLALLQPLLDAIAQVVRGSSTVVVLQQEAIDGQVVQTDEPR
jgi:hypothetical protein